jgi:peroxiredoxin (alkyl hydroperoxide reductase subunit C)
VIEVGAAAPDFTLRDQDGHKVSLEDLRGKRTVLVFYPLDFSPVCTDQLNVYNEVLSDIEAQGVQLYGVSVDSAYAHKAFQEHLGIRIPLLADFHPKGELAKQFGLYDEKWGNSSRALVMIGPDLTVEWIHRSPSALEIPGANLIFDAIAQRAGSTTGS